MSALYCGDTDCKYGWLGHGDCTKACNFDAISIDPQTGLPVVDQDKCTGCGACAKACPKGVIELRNKGVKDRRVYVSCINKDKGAVARKACKAACIGCGKCAKICPFGAITVENNVAYIDFTKCKLCTKCVAECPTGAIHAVNFPPKPAKLAAPAPAPATEAKPVEPVAAPEVKPAENN
jgi:Fe-S-cluster-containing hydrogenase component 2